MIKLSYQIVFVFVFLLFSCSEDDSSTGPDNDNTAPTFSEINSTVFQASCAFSGCHASDTKMAGLDLSSANAYANLVNVTSTQNPALKRVDPGNSSNSYLIKKLLGDGTTRMPLNRSALSQDKIDMIAEWIDAGAENN